MKIRNGSIFGTDERMHKTDLCFENGVITETSSEGEYDATGCYVLPGLIDTHTHGAFGVDFFSGKPLKKALDQLAKRGVTGILPTVSTRRKEDFLFAVDFLGRETDDRILGIHTEGPFLNPVRKGAMMEMYMTPPDLGYFRELYAASRGKIRLATVAPELDGVRAFAELCSDLGVHLSMGHTDATYAEAARAADWGICRVTHAYNAMRPLHHREPGVLGFAFDDDRIMCELICDFGHVSPQMVRLALKAKGYRNLTVISDNSSWCGYSDGDYDNGDGRMMTIRNGLCYKTGTDTISGSCLCLSEHAKKLFSIGVPPAQIAVMTSTNPAKVCGCSDRGSFAPGNRADIVVFDRDFNVKDVFLRGEKVEENEIVG